MGGGTFRLTRNPPPAPPASPTIDRAIRDIYALDGNPEGAVLSPCPPNTPCVNNSGAGDFDLAIGRLAQDIDATLATPAVIGTRKPINGDTVTQFGYGCNQKLPNQAGFDVKRTRTFVWPPVDVNCSGDSGGPIFLGNAAANGPIVAVTSGNQSGANTGDTDAYPAPFKAHFEALMRSLDDDSLEPTEPGVNRGGGDLPGMPDAAGSSLALCQAECAANPKCRAYTYAGGSLCWLKGSVPTPTAGTGMASGVMQNGLEIGINRGGGDITNFTSTGATSCRDSCNQRTDCQAFTFRAVDSMCYLKSRAPNPVPLDGVTSGLAQHRALFNLGGSDLAGMPLTNQSFDGCEAACAARTDCKAYTFTINNNNCWLKSAVPAATSCNSCWSGIKRSLEVNVDRGNNDLAGMPVPSPSASDCQRQCVLTNDCVAFT